MTQSLDSFKCRKTLKVGAQSYAYYSLKEAEKHGLSAAYPVRVDQLVGRRLMYATWLAVAKDCAVP